MTLAHLPAGRTRAGALFAALLLLAALGTGVLVGQLASGNTPALVVLVPVLLLPVLLWKRPDVGVLIMLGATVTIEQFDFEVGPRSGTLTAKIPFFHSVTPGSGITLAELFLALLVIFWIMRSVRAGVPLLHLTPLNKSIFALAGLAVVYMLVGASRHGDIKMALWELRPFVYLTVGYVLASSLVTTTRAIRTMLWVFVVGSGIKAVYAVTIWWSVRSLQPRPEAVAAHEESFFFGLFIFLTLALWIFGQRGWLRRVATVLFPIVLWADMCNSRRTAWAILMIGGVVLAVTAYVRLPNRRRVLRRLAMVTAVIASVYFPAYWHHDGTLAQPARAVRSVIAPDARDEQSNQYRYVENANLALNIQMHKSTGTGFGVPIVYAIPMVDLRSQNSSIAYIPHNTVLWVWMRMGVLGEVLFWFVIAQAVIAACRLGRAPDREAALFGALVAGAVVAYVIMGNQDLGLYWFRIALCIGILLGAVEGRLRSLRREQLDAGGPETRTTPSLSAVEARS
ncbi:MAG: hypothetical protein ACXVXJ_06885 [Mycobacteriaceae bacterium]